MTAASPAPDGGASVVRPAHLRPGLIALVAAGGAVGTAARYLLSVVWPPIGGWPVATLTANLLGAFLLGVLLETLVRRSGPNGETRGVQRVRLAVGTGVIGGFTTFSSLALETERLLAAGQAGTAIAYAAATVVVGFLVCLLGVVLAARRHRAAGTAGRGSR